MSANTVVLADGQFPTATEPLAFLQHAEHVVCCDGAILKWMHYAETHARDGVDVVVVGDGDSLPRSLVSSLGTRFVHSSDQECNDLTKAIKYCVSHGLRNIAILGATGLREDHTLGNISLLTDYASMGVQVMMFTDTGVFIPIISSGEDSSVFHFSHVKMRTQVSLFALTPSCELSVTGLRFPIDHRCLTSWWQGTLNEVIDNSFTIELHTEGKMLVYLTYRPKDTTIIP